MQISEHPFGTIKHYDDGRSLPLQSKEMVAADCSISALAYNIRRAINLCGSVQNLTVIAEKLCQKPGKSWKSEGPSACQKVTLRGRNAASCAIKRRKKAGTATCGWPAFTNVTFSFVLPVALAVGGGIAQNMVLRAEDAVVVFVIDIFIPGQVPLLRHRAFIGQRRDSPLSKICLQIQGVL